jgi:AcrR family transcriptional regulator
MATRKYEQRLRAEGAEETRRRILEAVYERLREDPSRPVSVDRVAQDAKVARSTVYLIFGSRAGLFDALCEDLFERAGYERLLQAKELPDARDHLRHGLRTGVEMFAAFRDVARALYSMAALDSEATGGAIRRVEEERSRGMARLAGRLEQQGRLRAGVDAKQAADLLWVLTSFDSFDALYTGRGLAVDEVVERLTITAERTLLR